MKSLGITGVHHLNRTTEMNKIMILGLILVIFNLISYRSIAQREIYTHEDFQSFASSHQMIAILPFKANIKLRPKQMQSMSETQLRNLQEQEGLAVQSALHTYYLKRKEQGKAKMSVDVQPPHTTNALLRKANVSQENYYDFTVQELADILGVEAVVHGELNTSSPMSEGASVAMGLAVGYFGATNNGDISIQLSDGKTGTLLWKYDKTLSRSLGSDTQSVINAMMKKASKKWPYDEESLL